RSGAGDGDDVAAGQPSDATAGRVVQGADVGDVAGGRIDPDVAVVLEADQRLRVLQQRPRRDIGQRGRVQRRTLLDDGAVCVRLVDRGEAAAQPALVGERDGQRGHHV